MFAKLAVLTNWASTSGLGVNPSKTELVLFSRRYKIPPLSPPTLCGTSLTFSKSAKYLGLTIDSKLSWSQNTEERVRKATIALYTCKKAIGLKWGMSPKVVRWLYCSVILPILLYGVIVWWKVFDKKTYLQKIARVQRTAGLYISGGLSTTSSEALDSLLFLLPVDLMGKQTAILSAIRMREAGVWNDQDIGHSLITKAFPNIPKKTDYSIPIISISPSFFTHFPSREDWNTGTPGPPNSTHIYTDGSKLNDRTGGGVFSNELNIKHSFRLPDHCSVFQAEVAAIGEAISRINQENFSKPICIFSDSQAAIKSLGNILSHSKTVIACRRSLQEIANHVPLHLIWVPGHRDISGNCIADELAREGTNLPLLQEREHFGIPLSTCKLQVKTTTEHLANSRWLSSPLSKTTKLIWPQRSKKRTNDLLNLGRTNCRSVVRVATGHWLIGEHASRLLVPTHDFCRSCKDIEEEETVEHFLCNCPALAKTRFKLLGAPFFDNLSELKDTTPRQLAHFINISGWREPCDQTN